MSVKYDPFSGRLIIVPASTGGPGGAVDSVNSYTGVVVLDADDIDETASRIWFTTAEETKLAGIETGADVTDATNVGAAGAFMKSTDDSDDITEGATKLLLTVAERTKLSNTSGVNTGDQNLAPYALDADVVHDTGNENIGGIKTFTSDPLIPDEAYGAGWNGSLEPPTKNAVYDKIETISGGSGLTHPQVLARSLGA